MNIAEQLAKIAENEPKVFDAGKKAQYDEFWDSIQEKGESYVSYQYSFGGGRWNNTTFQPKYDLKGKSFFRCFAESAITTIEKTIDLTRVTGSTSMQNMFNNAIIVTINNFVVGENTTFHNTAFNGCTELVTLNMTGTIAKNNLDLSTCTKLSATSVLSILNACNKENAGVTITLPSKCIDKKTVTETYIANNTDLATALANADANGYTISFR